MLYIYKMQTLIFFLISTIIEIHNSNSSSNNLISKNISYLLDNILYTFIFSKLFTSSKIKSIKAYLTCISGLILYYTSHYMIYSKDIPLPTVSFIVLSFNLISNIISNISKREYSQLEQSPFNDIIYVFILNHNLTYMIYYYIKDYISYNEIYSMIDNGSIMNIETYKDFGIKIILFGFNCCLFGIMIKYISTSSTSSYRSSYKNNIYKTMLVYTLKSLTSSFVLFGLVLLNYNANVCNYIYQFVFNSFPQPINLILYNAFGFNVECRVKFLILLWLYAKQAFIK